MTISFPISLPTHPGIVSARFFTQHAVAVSESPYTFTEQKQIHPGQRWGAEFTLPPMDREDAEKWECLLLQLNGMAGTFYLGDPLKTEPRGNWSGVPVADGAGQSGQIFQIRGLVEGATIEPGDFFQVGSRLHKYMGFETAVADSSGEVTIDIWPRLRESPPDGAAVITNSPKGLFRLASNDYDLYQTHEIFYESVTLSAVEAL